MSSKQSAWISAAEAARALDVTRATLYAYVSRGIIRSEPKPGTTRERRYSRDDVDRLRRRTEARRDPDGASTQLLQWGLPVLESAIALIDDDRLYYRGQDAVTLARTRTLEEVAALIWTGNAGVNLSRGVESVESASAAALASKLPPRNLPFMARATTVLAHAATRDPHAYDLRPASIAATGWRILRLLTRVAADVDVDADAATIAESMPIDDVLARAWGLRARDADLLRSALILCADHELNVSSFTARCVASAGASPYAVVIAGLAALSGVKHGGMTARAHAMLESLRPARDLPAALTDRLSRGEPLYGFGHPLYRTGDPRATALIDMLREKHASSRELTFAIAVSDTITRTMREAPTIDFALATLTRVLRVPSESALTIFALGRTIGWIGHAIEQYAKNELIRPRAKYVGVLPGAAAAGTDTAPPRK